MASKHPVPSRAALNALRGVILTTSCSVILLAEERRRRLQIARAAIENARKLHVVQSNRGPIALAETNASWEGRFAEVDQEVLSMASLPRPRTSTRRRGRSHLIGSQNENESHNNDNGRTQSLSRANAENTATEFNSSADLLNRGLDMVDLEKLRLASLKPRINNVLEWKAPRPAAQRNPSMPSPSTEARTADANTTSHLVEEPSLETDVYEPILDNPEAQDADSVEVAQVYLEKASQGRLNARPFYDDATLALEQLLKDLETSCFSGATSLERIDLAVKIFQRIAAYGPPLPRVARPLRSQGIRLLQIISTACPDRLAATLTTLLPLNKDPLKFLTPLITFAQDGGNRRAVRDCLVFLSQNAKSCSWARGMLICRLLTRHARIHADFDQTKRLYRVLQDAGLFEEVSIPQSTLYKIRRSMVILALEHGDDSFADVELGLLNKLDVAACKSDIRLQTRVIARNAAKAKWADVFSDIEVLGQKSNVQCVDFQRMLTRATEIFAQNHNARELEMVLRKFATDYQLKLKNRWIYTVFDYYASRRQVEPAFSWLQFCSNNGLQMDSACNERFFATCRKFWGFSGKTIHSLEARLRDLDCVRQRPGATAKITPAGDNGDLSRQMRSMASNEEWERVAEVYETAVAAGRDIPAECFRFVVLAHTKGPNPDMERASKLIQSNYEEGHDVTEALTPLLLAKLKRGDDPCTLINNALRMGVRLHDSAYNKAAQALSAIGNHQAAAEMCEIAARENGGGQLLYNEYNFANLVFAYTGSASYKALQSLLSTFTSDVQWWHGSRTCKETIKLAMKTTAMRSVAHEKNSAPHRQALDRLDNALIHVKMCRSTRGDRQTVSEAYVRLAAVPSIRAHQKTNRTPGNKAHKARQGQEVVETSQPELAAAVGSG